MAARTGKTDTPGTENKSAVGKRKQQTRDRQPDVSRRVGASGTDHLGCFPLRHEEEEENASAATPTEPPEDQRAEGAGRMRGGDQRWKHVGRTHASCRQQGSEVILLRCSSPSSCCCWASASAIIKTSRTFIRRPGRFQHVMTATQ